MSAFVALTEKSIPFELDAIDLEKHENLDTDFAQRSITRRVPMLHHGDFYLSESLAICEYLEESFPASAHINIYPTNRQERVRARQI